MGKRDLLATALEQTNVGQLLSTTVAKWNGVVVFNYHRIGNPLDTNFDRALFNATQDEFAEQVEFLKQNYDVIGISDLNEVMQDSASRAVMITFDDGYLDNHELALPVLAANECPAVFFITSGYLDRQPISWWDEVAWMLRTSDLQELTWPERIQQTFDLTDAPQTDQAIREILLILKSIPEEDAETFLNDLGTLTHTGRCPAENAAKIWMNWDMIRDLDQAGMDIGGHTVDHPVLANCDLERQFLEIETSKKRIEHELGHPITAFSYPVGQTESFTDQTKLILQEVGYEWGFSFYGGYMPPLQYDRYDMKRMPVDNKVDPNLFRSIARLPQLFARK